MKVSFFMLIDNNEAFVAKYSYDEWGKYKAFDSQGKEITSQSHIVIINPFIYKSYYYTKKLVYTT